MRHLPFNLENIIYQKTVENFRVEYKKTFDKYTEKSICKTICAFANDYNNLDGGWIILGIEAKDGYPITPFAGINIKQIDRIQQRIRVIGKTQINPSYYPQVFTAVYEEINLIIIYVPAGEERPYDTPDPRDNTKREYFIRIGSETIKADKHQRNQLFQMSSKIPFDDRINIESNIEDIDPSLVRNFLFETDSGLKEEENIDLSIYKKLRLVKQYHDSFKPRNVTLFFFNNKPSNFYPGCYFEVAQFGDNAGGNLIEEKIFSGSLDTQVSQVINYLNNLTTYQYQKSPSKAKVEKVIAFPFEALEETIVNAAYHRGFDGSSEPNKVYLYPDRIEILSYPGPVPGLTMEDFKKDMPIPQVPLRNRRIGEFLKELRLAEMRSTGVPKIKKSMEENGSPDPEFVFDDSLSYFKVILPAHPNYVLIHAIRESSYLWSIGERKSAKQLLHKVFNENNSSGAIAGLLIEYYYQSGETSDAEKVYQEFVKADFKTEVSQPYLRYFKFLINDDKPLHAKKVINSLDAIYHFESAYDVAVSFKRVKEFEKSHIVLSKIYTEYCDKFDYLKDYADVKIKLTFNELYDKKRTNWPVVKRLQREAHVLLSRAIYLDTDDVSKAWCWYQLARVRIWLKYSKSQIDECYLNAIRLLPEEKQFREHYNEWLQRSQGKS